MEVLKGFSDAVEGPTELVSGGFCVDAEGVDVFGVWKGFALFELVSVSFWADAKGEEMEFFRTLKS